MNQFKVVLTNTAQADINKLETTMQTRILDKLEWMGENADLLHHQTLQGEEWSGCYKYRLGDYRLIYKIDRKNQVMTILKIAHRREVYKKQ